ncbi:MAG: hypothetical protein ABIS67_14270 [Candidatus Eisenbacteria bacterium]
MKTLATLVLLIALAAPAGAAVVHDEAVNGDLSSLAASPTALVFLPGGNTVIGTVRYSNNVAGDRDFITFTIAPGNVLIALNLLAYAPSFTSFAAFNAGATSYVPGIATDPNFLAGIHITGGLVGSNLMPEFDTNAVTSNSLAAPQLDPGTYSFVIQQTGTALQSYSLEFVVDGPVPSQSPSWGAIKSLYR